MKFRIDLFPCGIGMGGTAFRMVALSVAVCASATASSAAVERMASYKMVTNEVAKLEKKIAESTPADYANVSNKAMTALQTETDPTVGLTNGTIYIHGSTITPADSAITNGLASTNFVSASVADKRDRNDRVWEATWNHRWWDASVEEYVENPTFGIFEGPRGGFAISVINPDPSSSGQFGMIGRNETLDGWETEAEALAATEGYASVSGVAEKVKIYKNKVVSNLALTTEIPTASQISALTSLLFRVSTLDPSSTSVSNLIQALKGNQ